MRRKVILMMAVLAAVIPAGAALAGWQTFLVSHGLAGNDVKSVAEDSNGNMWFGTYDGLSRFDGIEWTTYTEANGLVHRLVWGITQDSSGGVWFGTGGGVSRFDGSGWTTYTEADGLVDDYVQAITADGAGDIWVGTYRGVSRFDGAEWTTYTAEDGLASDRVVCMAADSRGNMWFGSDSKGVSRFDGDNWVTLTTADGLASNAVHAITEDSGGNMWFGTGGGVSRFDGMEEWIKYTEADGLVYHSVRAIAEDRAGNMWFATHRGVSRFDGMEEWTTYTEANGLADPDVKAITVDRAGNVWFATYKGVSRFDNTEWTTYTEADGLVYNYISALTEDRHGDMWFATGRGVSRFDGMEWTTYTTEDGLASNNVECMTEDSRGHMWFGTYAYGVSRFYRTWTTYTTENGLAGNSVSAITEDSSGDMWFGVIAEWPWDGVVSRFDGREWTTYTTEDGLADYRIHAITEDSSGDMWFGTWGGVSRFDGTEWTTYTIADGLVSNGIYAIAEDSSGNMWVGSWGGVSRYDGTEWITYITADGLAGNSVVEIIEDGSGNMWFGTEGGVSRFDGTEWTTYTKADGLAANFVAAIAEDRSGDMWFGTPDGVTRYRLDRVAPQTMIWPRPSPVTASPTQTIAFRAGFNESDMMDFSYSFDGSPWSEWSRTDYWTGIGLADGLHEFQVRCRDRAGNVDSTPAVCTFEVDARPPVPVIVSPPSGQVVRGSVTIEGTADDPRFDRYWMEARFVAADSWDLIIQSASPVVSSLLAEWNTSDLPDGDYEIRLSVRDTLGLTGIALNRLVVDNEAPWAKGWETAPVLVRASSGGDVYTPERDVHLYFPPRTFEVDAVVSIDSAENGSVPDTLDTGATLVHAGYGISWEGMDTKKPITFEMALDEGAGDIGAGDALALYVLPEGGDVGWQRLGGTLNPDGKSISAPIDCEGIYSIYSDSGVSGPGGGLSDISFAPRVFSPRGSFGNTEVAISFTLGRSGPVNVKVYNRAGYLVRELVNGQHMNAGANVVRWDGRDAGGTSVPDGLYMTAVEALGETKVNTLSIVR